MGIRYYAYAFDADQTQRAIDDPHSILSDDPLADAWGLIPHAAVSPVMGEQTVPRRDMLYLDKAWGFLQALTEPTGGESPRPAYRMFAGRVSFHGLGWDPFVRTILPAEIPGIRDDLDTLTSARVQDRLREWNRPGDVDADIQYTLHYLDAARRFVTALAADGRGMVYLIG
ncbi:MAG: DUF1877 family protein [Microbacterium sp.]